jgi:hypothetical protein
MTIYKFDTVVGVEINEDTVRELLNCDEVDIDYYQTLENGLTIYKPAHDVVEALEEEYIIGKRINTSQKRYEDG